MAFSVVLLPAPFGPMIAETCPSEKVAEMPLRMFTPGT